MLASTERLNMVAGVVCFLSFLQRIDVVRMSSLVAVGAVVGSGVSDRGRAFSSPLLHSNPKRLNLPRTFGTRLVTLMTPLDLMRLVF